VLDPRTPVLVGAGQWSNRVDEGAPPVEPVDLIAEALRRADDDAGAGSALTSTADAVWIVRMLSWRYANPAALVAERLGASPRDTAVGSMGGSEPQVLVRRACQAIASGQADTVLIGGAEAWRTRTTRGGGKELGWTREDDPRYTDLEPARTLGSDVPMSHPAELARGLVLPAQFYPLFEQAIRHRAGRDVAEHIVEVSELWAGFSRVAASNPYAWIRTAMTASEIRTPSPANRWIFWPYTKVMNANNAVDQSAGLIVTSAQRARALGVPRDRWVFPLAAAEAHDPYAVSHRRDLASSPAIRLAGARMFEMAGRDVNDVRHVDLYSCFPSAVQIAATELGLATDRDLTVTGGLSFAGGPWNNYVTHALATMLGVLRDDPGTIGLVSAMGGYVTKHALAVYSTQPPDDGFRWETVQDHVDALPTREVLEHADSEQPHHGEIESWVVGHDRDGSAEQAFAAVNLDDGRRAWATSTGPQTLEELTSGAEQIGRKVKVGPDGTLLL
jgi:acetyl-CoA C-acetyltransferase